MLRSLAFALLILPAAAAAQDGCPPAPNHSDEVLSIIADLQQAPSEAAAMPLMDRLWRLWTDAPDARAQELLDRGMAQREGFDFLGARDTFDRLVDYCPDYAEGYNQRAFASFLRQEYPAALADLDRALDLSPHHVAALSGKALTLMGLGRTEEGLEVLRSAVALNPWLQERAMLPVAPGVDL